MKIKISKLMSAILMFMVVANVNSACFFTMHQPEIPEAALKLSKLD